MRKKLQDFRKSVPYYFVCIFLMALILGHHGVPFVRAILSSIGIVTFVALLIVLQVIFEKK